jgi:hypothetical protein
VTAVRLTAALALVLMFQLPCPTPAAARLCDVLPIDCTFEGPAFVLAVVDAETRQRLSGVQGLAEWGVYGLHGGGGPLMVQDAVSDQDGTLRFPAWGPVTGPHSGVQSPLDPVVSLFKPGYRPLVVYNTVGVVPGRPRHKVRIFGQAGRTFEMSPFRGTPTEWYEELRRLAAPQVARISREDLRRFRTPYLARFRLVQDEMRRLPTSVVTAASNGRPNLHLLETYLRTLEEGR